MRAALMLMREGMMTMGDTCLTLNSPDISSWRPSLSHAWSKGSDLQCSLTMRETREELSREDVPGRWEISQI